MIAQICIYTSGEPNASPARKKLYDTLVDMGFTVLVDSVHWQPNWFNDNFHNKNHRAFYIEPFLMGLVPEINFTLMGPPDFCIWFNDTSEQENSWESVAAYTQLCLAGGDCAQETINKAKHFLGTHVVPECLTMSALVESDGDVIVRDLKEYYYEFKNLAIPEKDQMIYSVRKPFTADPFTIIIDKFSLMGSRNFFADLFACPEWGTDYCDVQFLKQLWEELNMEGDLDIDELLKERTRQFLPNGVDCPLVEPRVKRVKLSDVPR